MEFQRVSEIRYKHRLEAECLKNDATDKYRPRSIGKNALATAILRLPLLQVSLDVNVVNTTSRTILTHRFSNDNDEAITEATYSFPLYNGSTVISFTCWIGGVTIVSSVESRTKAQEEYQAAVSRKDIAIHLKEYTPEIFEINLGNIPARTDVRIEITYVNELKPDFGGEGVLVTIPTSIAPRYGNPPEGYTQDGNSSLKSHNGMDIRIGVSAPVPIRKLESRTHPISVEIGSAAHPVSTNTFGDFAAGTAAVDDNRRAQATLSHNTPVLERDFVLLISVRGPGLFTPRAVMESCPQYPNSSAIRVAFKPQNLFFGQLPQHSFKAEVIFVADRSGSMGPKITSLKRALGIFLQSIPQNGFHFNIASFGTDCNLLWPQSKSYDQNTLKAAHQHLATFAADRGGTEILGALEKVVESRLINTGLPTEILILTDGEVWEASETIEFVRATREKLGDRIRFFALGIGDAVSHKLVEGIGRYGGGFADVLAVNSPGSWDARVVKMLKGALSPSSWNCQIIPKTDKGKEKQVAAGTTKKPFINVPYKIPPLFDSVYATTYLFIEDSNTQYESVTVHGTSSTGQTATVDIPIERVAVSTPMILHLAAKAMLIDMESGRSQIHEETIHQLKLSKSAANAHVQRKGEQLGKKWSITGKWTSFVGKSSDLSSSESHFTRIYRANRAELAELTEFRGGYHQRDEDGYMLGNEEDEDGDMEEKEESGDSDEDTGGQGRGGDNRDDGNGDRGGSGQGGYGDEGRSGPSQDGDEGNGTSKYPRPESQGERDHNHSNSGREGGCTDGNDQTDYLFTEVLDGNEAGVGAVTDHPFWSKWLPVQVSSGTATTVTDNKLESTVSEGEIGLQKITWFQSGSGTRKEVFMVEIARHFGPGTIVNIGSNENVEGYWVTTKRDPDVELERSLTLQTVKWEEERTKSGAPVSYLLSNTYKSKQFGDLQSATRSSDTSQPEFRSIINCYDHSGCFGDSPEAMVIFSQLLESFKLGMESAMVSRLRADDNLHQISDKISRTIISMIYIKKSYPAFEGVWELIIRKAEAWVDSVAPILLELERICSCNWIGREVQEDESLKVEEDWFREASWFYSIPPTEPYSIPPTEPCPYYTDLPASFPGYDSSLPPPPSPSPPPPFSAPRSRNWRDNRPFFRGPTSADDMVFEPLSGIADPYVAVTVSEARGDYDDITNGLTSQQLSEYRLARQSENLFAPRQGNDHAF